MQIALIWLIAAFFFAGIAYVAWSGYRQSRREFAQADAQRRVDIEQGYADLLPDFHPSKVLDYVLAQYGRAVEPDFVKTRAADFTFRKSEEGGEVRTGNGIFRIHLKNPEALGVHYVDTDREFRWVRTLTQGEHWQYERGPGARPPRR